ncbi:MAG: hypothetical protein NC903_02400 [Candidatus Omnitrophica bacterium]|nr:hypothetical protein [Candidatus Omnitrophota bacterium]
MKEKVVINLNQKEQMELERIVTDSDEKQALIFLKEVVKKKVDKANAEGCKPVFEWKTKEPQMLTELKEKTKIKRKGVDQDGLR